MTPNAYGWIAPEVEGQIVLPIPPSIGHTDRLPQICERLSGAHALGDQTLCEVVRHPRVSGVISQARHWGAGTMGDRRGPDGADRTILKELVGKIVRGRWLAVVTGRLKRKEGLVIGQ